jgi:hypothetical protein
VGVVAVVPWWTQALSQVCDGACCTELAERINAPILKNGEDSPRAADVKTGSRIA